MTLYNTLGVDKNASKEDIKKAYHNKAKKHHPDKKDGDTEKMAEITRAYSILSDEDKRNYYDTTGRESEDSFEQKFMSLVSQVFNHIMEQNDVDYTDLVSEFKEHILHLQKNCENNKTSLNKKLKKLENVKKRIKSDKDNVIALFLDEQIQTCNNGLKSTENDIKFLDKAYDVIATYNYNFDQNPGVSGTTFHFNMNQ